LPQFEDMISEARRQRYVRTVRNATRVTEQDYEHTLPEDACRPAFYSLGPENGSDLLPAEKEHCVYPNLRGL
jgi:hypothetical protein